MTPLKFVIAIPTQSFAFMMKRILKTNPRINMTQQTWNLGEGWGNGRMNSMVKITSLSWWLGELSPTITKQTQEK